MRSILNDTKQVLGVAVDNTDFDIDIIMHINSAIFLLMQLGVGPPLGLVVEDQDETWDDLLGNRRDLNIAKSYIFVVVRLVFDRPETSYGIQALEKLRDEWAWRLELQGRMVPNG